jgi:hypothetical protein
VGNDLTHSIYANQLIINKSLGIYQLSTVECPKQEIPFNKFLDTLLQHFSIFLQGGCPLIKEKQTSTQKRLH